jgi:hypothetical protein
MAEVKDMYKLTRFLNSKKYHEKVDAENSRSPLDIRGELAILFKDSRRFFKRDLTHVVKLINRTESNGYIRIIGDEGLGVFDLTDKGFHLIGKSYYFFRVGLWDETSKHYDKSQTVLTAIVIAVISAVGGTVAGVIIGSK